MHWCLWFLTTLHSLPKKPKKPIPTTRGTLARSVTTRAAIGAAMTKQSWDHGGKSRHERGYGTAWDKLRETILERDKHLCQPCIRKGNGPRVARQVDHIKPKAKGGTDAPDNLQAICGPCHRDKTACDNGRRPKPMIGGDGWPM